jgi:hypothetical protein
MAAVLFLSDLYPDAGPWLYRTITPIVAMAGMAVYSVVLIAALVSGIRQRRRINARRSIP